jgi:two-component system response regulator
MNRQLILVVEDNPDHMELAVTALQEHAVTAEIAVARDGAEALEFLFGQGRHAGRDANIQPALVLLDMQLPKLSGLDVLRQMRANPVTALTPVVMLTSSTESMDVLACSQSGANSFIHKPVNFGAFTEKLKSLQSYWLGAHDATRRPEEVWAGSQQS